MTTTVEIVGGTKGPVALDSDKNWVGLIANKNSQTIKVVAQKNGAKVEKVYGLSSLTLESEAA